MVCRHNQGLAGLAAANAITTSVQASKVSVTIFEAGKSPGLAGCTTQVDSHLIDVPPRMAILGYYDEYMKLVHKLQVPVRVVKTDCAYSGKDKSGMETLHLYEKSHVANLYNAIFDGGVNNFWKVLRAMSSMHQHDGELQTGMSFGDWLEKYLDFHPTSESKSWNGNAKGSAFDLCALLQHKNQFLCIIVGSLCWMLSCTYEQLMKYPADILLPYIQKLSISKGILGAFSQSQVVRVDPSIKALERSLLYGVDNLHCNYRVTDVDEKKTINGVQYDAIICATEASAVPRILTICAPVFEKFRYHPSTIYLHTDQSFMPRNKENWRTWHVHMSSSSEEAELTFWLNEFFPGSIFDRPTFQTWAPSKPPKPETVIKRFDFQRVVHTENTKHLVAKVEAQQGGNGGIYYAGSYCVYGMGLLEQAALSGRVTGERVLKDLFKHE